MSRRTATGLGALGAYALISFLYFGLRLLPHPGRELVGYGADPDIFVWSFAWWPHAILHAQNPIVSHVVWAPDGVDLAWATSVPGLALLFSPLTLVFGPAVAYNTAAVALPALAAWTGFLLCRHLTRSFWPALVGGYLFGFSSYVLGQTQGHMHMTAVFLVPLVALVVLRFVQGELEARGLVWRLGVLLGLQFTFSTEVFFTVTFAFLVAAGLAYLAVPDVRARLRALPLPTCGAYGLAMLIASPLVVYSLRDFETGSVNRPGPYSADLLNLVVPTHLVGVATGWTNTISQRFPGNAAEAGAYLGVPALVVVVWYLLAGRRSGATRFLAAALAVSLFVELGTALWVGGDRVATLPWEYVSRLPLFDNVLPVRFSLYASLVAAVIVALWAAASGVPRWARVAGALVVVLSVVPTVREPNWTLRPDRPEFFAHGNLVAACLGEHETVLVFPFPPRSHAMLWQAENDFRFRMAAGYLRPSAPKSFARYPAVRKAVDVGPQPTLGEIMQLARAKGVTRILSVLQPGQPTAKELDRATGSVQVVGGVAVGPACGRPGMTAGGH